MVLLLSALVVASAIGTAMEANGMALSGGDAVYYALITITTVGLGDFAPDPNTGLTGEASINK